MTFLIEMAHLFYRLYGDVGLFVAPIKDTLKENGILQCRVMQSINNESIFPSPVSACSQPYSRKEDTAV